MELTNFLEKFLPDYEAKVEPYYMSKNCLVNAEEFYDKYFPEAFKNYEKQRKEELQVLIEKICKKQRENCAENALVVLKNLYDGNGVLPKKGILNAEQPKIEEIYES